MIKVKCKIIVETDKFCGSFRPCWLTKIMHDSGSKVFTFSSDCRNTVEIGWTDYIIHYKDVVEIK